MRKNLILLVFIFISVCTYGQTVQIVEQNESFDPKSQIDEYTTRENRELFEYIDEKFDLNNHQFVAVLSGYSANNKDTDLGELFEDFWWESNVMGANAFTIDSQYTVSDTIHVVIKVYYFNESDVDINSRYYPTNMIYVFGHLDKDHKRGKRIKFNGQRLTLNPFEYLSYQNEVGKRVKLSVGGFLGSSVRVEGRDGKLPRCYSLSGYNLAPLGGGYPNNPASGISFNTGRIYSLSPSFGRFLIHFMNKKEITDLEVIEVE